MSKKNKQKDYSIDNTSLFHTFFNPKPRKFKTEIPYRLGYAKDVDFKKEVPNPTDRKNILDNIEDIEFMYNHFQNTPNIDGKKLNRNMSLALLGNIGVESGYDPKSEQGTGDLGKGLFQWTSKDSNPYNRTWKNFEKSAADPYSLLDQSNLIIDSWQSKYSDTYKKYDTEAERLRHRDLGVDAMTQKYRDLILQESEKEDNLKHLTELITKGVLRPSVPHQNRRNAISAYLNKMLKK